VPWFRNQQRSSPILRCQRFLSQSCVTSRL